MPEPRTSSASKRTRRRRSRRHSRSAPVTSARTSAVGLEDRPASSCIGYACLGSARMDLVIWVVVLVAAIVIPAGALALKLRPRAGAQIVLATAYLRALRTTNDKKRKSEAGSQLFADLRDEHIT